ncbi:MAG: TetR/AcrR family transcriptional regulator [Gammaproteobacteria bacterium]|jgi:AcrR family transcriptional regulator|nr:TetR/AcrR family transcriptional regulator [Gammaproteobacteria bacterium]MBT5216417.1 TetR/AcrR family transcriptional regulator [Gammaproteobacteria bacterium]MBT5542590.1 TetR/AcrR family transcriptional regulator [Gammaproteobacteria bacterium]MBT6073609.1 TetR/AcrR family transcriptional regulator [Gammaproteobacteria bacterium]MBT7753458.1 TetR/AcrR family transcriptional regulator [Gammaproteobacteria bacterium]
MSQVTRKTFKNLTDKHINVIEDFESLLETGIANLTMSDIASHLKVSLRTLYEIAPSKEDLITTTMDRILTNIGREALNSMKDIDSPLERLRIYMRIGNEAAGPKLQKFDGDLDKIRGAKEMIDFHQNYFISFIKSLLDEAQEINEIKNIDTQAVAISLGGIARELSIPENKKTLEDLPEKSSNMVTDLILESLNRK